MQLRPTVLALLALTGLAAPAAANPYDFEFERSFTVTGISTLYGLTFDPNTKHLFGVTAAGIPDTLYEFTTNGALIAATPLPFIGGVGSSRSLAFDTHTGTLYVGECGAGGRLYEITTAGAFIRTMPTGFCEAMAYDSVSGTLFLGQFFVNVIHEINKTNGSLIQSFAAPAGSARAMAFDGCHLLSFSSPNVYTIDPSDGTELASDDIGIGSGDVGMAFGDGRLYVWNSTFSRIDVFTQECSCCCDADSNDDGTVGIADFQLLAACFNSTFIATDACANADANCDGIVNVADYAILACQFGGPPTPDCCYSLTVTTETPGVFCVEGAGNGSGWSWQIDTSPVVNITGSLPAAPSNLRDAFVASITAASLTGVTATAGPGSRCFTIAAPSAFQFYVGPTGSATCLVSGNPSGCPFNPKLYEERFLPVPVPTLGTPILLALAGLMVASGGFVIRSRGRSVRDGR